MKFETKEIAIKDLQRNTGQIAGVPKNPRLIKDNNFNKLKASIQQDPEMLELREIIAYEHEGKFICIGGNMRFEALKALGYTSAKCKVISECDTEQLKRIILKDNSAYGEWDFDELANEWEEALLNACAIDIPTIDEPKLEDEAEEDEFDETKETIPARCSKGDIWQLGNHRLFVGDCTIEDNISRLMDGNRADITFTSPPYNMCSNNIQNIFKSEKIKKSYDIQNGTYREFSDALNDEQYSQLLIDSLKNALKFSDDALFNIGILQGSKNGIIEMLKAYQNNFCDILVWNKNNSLPMGMSSMHGAVSHRCELIFCFNQKGTRRFTHPQWDEHGTYKGSSVINRIDTDNAANNEYAKEHHATFPVEFAAEVLKLYTETSVLELFGGTGTTLIAAEQQNRRCFICELDPHYCDIILARWEKLTGKQAVKLINQTE